MRKTRQTWIGREREDEAHISTLREYDKETDTLMNNDRDGDKQSKKE